MFSDSATAEVAGYSGSKAAPAPGRFRGLRSVIAALPILGLSFLSAAVAAAPLQLTDGEKVVERRAAPASYSVPTGPWKAGALPALSAEGEVVRKVWQVPLHGRTTLALMAPLRRQLREKGYEIVFECASSGCGGFDFRFALDLVPAPAMHVDLGDYRFLAARRLGAEGQPRYVTLLVSRAARRGFIHEVRVGPVQEPPPRLTAATKSVAAEAPAADAGGATAGSLAARLEANGRAVLDRVDFAPGVSGLGPDDIPALADLAAFLKARPDLRVALVGHTDATGSEAANIAISRARAQSVRQRLVKLYGLSPDRIEAEGVGYLAPLGPNDSEDGRRRNRRVEVVVIPSSSS